MAKTTYVLSSESGISRNKVGKKFHYYLPNGKKVLQQKTLDRIKALAIPPAYKNVWICPSTHGHIQAFGFDDQNRKQYIYHTHWTALQSKKKFDHLITFGNALASLRGKVAQDLKLKHLAKDKVIASVVRLLDSTCIRIGSPQYQSQGLLTLRKKHIRLKNKKIILDFIGKSKIKWHLEIKDKKLEQIFKICLAQTGTKFFVYHDDAGQLHPLTSNDVNHYLKEVTNTEITAKEFRTWQASSLFLNLALKNNSSPSEKILKNLITQVAKHIWNTPTVCKNSYIHPLVQKLFLKGELKVKRLKRRKHLNAAEEYLLHLLTAQTSN